MSAEEKIPAAEAQAHAPAPIAKEEKVETAPMSEAAVVEAETPAPISMSEASGPEPAPESKELEAKEPEAKSPEDTASETKAPEANGNEDKPATPPKDAAPTPAPVLTPLENFYAKLPAICASSEHREMWGIELSESKEDVPTQIVLTKFLRANNNDIKKATKQLAEALQWRKKMEPHKLLENTEFDKAKFGGLGFVTVHEGTKGKEIITWNIYGAVKDKKATFGNVEEFIKWRVALMELSLAQLSIKDATVPIPESGPDPYQMIQVHDYLNVSFLRMDPAVKASSKQIIQTFSLAYPELLKEKFFVNVPVVMGWVFAAMKIFLSQETVKKFHPLTYGQKLAGELADFGEKLPKAYGGKGGDVWDGLSVKYTPEATPPVAPAVAPASKVTAPATPAKPDDAEDEETQVKDDSKAEEANVAGAAKDKDVAVGMKEEEEEEAKEEEKDVIVATPLPGATTTVETATDKETAA